MSKQQLYLLAFIEGVSVLIIELLGGKLLVPFFGNSLIIWTSTIGVTMSSLMIGYFIGGALSKIKFNYTLLILIFSLVASWISLMPVIAPKTISFVADSNLYIGSIISAILLLSAPLISLGVVPPILIQLSSKDSVGGGSVSGKIFAVSTIGSISSTLFVGFVVIEKYGVASPMMVFSIILFTLTTIALYKYISNKIIFALLALPLFFAFIINDTNHSNFLYKSESLQGQLSIEDSDISETSLLRRLYINGIPQTSVKMYPSDLSLNESIWYYVHMDGILSSTKPSGSDVLLMGFGGGSIAQELLKLNFNVDAVEIDHRLPKIAHDYFYFDTTRVNFFIEDARYFLNKETNKKYDLAVLDLLHGEVQPNHVLTIEGLNELKKHLKDDALVIVNYQSNYDEPKKPFLSILKTLTDAGFDAGFVPVRAERPADYVFIASPNKLPNVIVDQNHLNDCCFNNSITHQFIQHPRLVTLENAPDSIKKSIPTLIDDKPILELLNQESIKTWRKTMSHTNH